MSEKDKTPVAGMLVTNCTKCKLETGHVVVSQNRQGIVSKVKCQACGTEHRYYSDERRQKARKNRKETAKEAEIVRQAEMYSRLVSENSEKGVLPYSIHDTYHAEDIISHKTFGKGAIIKVYPEKIDVLFENGQRLLACNRPVS